MPTFRKRSTKPRKRNRNTKKNQNKFRKNVMRGGFSTTDFSHAIAISTFFGKNSFYIAKKEDDTKKMQEFNFTEKGVKFANNKYFSRNSAYFKPIGSSNSGSAIKNFDIYVSVVDKEYIQMNKNNWTGQFKDMLKALETAALGNADAIIESLPVDIQKNVIDAVEDMTSAAQEVQRIVDDEQGPSALDVAKDLVAVEQYNYGKMINLGVTTIGNVFGNAGNKFLSTIKDEKTQQVIINWFQYILEKALYVIWNLLVGLFFLLKLLVRLLVVGTKTVFKVGQQKFNEYQAAQAAQAAQAEAEAAMNKPSFVLPDGIPMEPDEVERLFIENLANETQVTIFDQAQKCNFTQDHEYNNFILIKKAGNDFIQKYRQLALKYHPDKIAKLGCTPAQVEVATRMIQEINYIKEKLTS